jgi:hypothetical protein
VILAYNEEKALPHVLAAVPRDRVSTVLVVDNASTDDTAAAARRGGATVVHEPRPGYGAACLRGIAALPPGAGIVVFLDGDYSDYPEDLPRLLDPIQAGAADLVLSSRILGASGRGALVPQAYWGNRLAVTLIRWIWRYRYTDLGPFRAIRRDALERLDMRDRNFGWTVEMQIRAVEEGLRILEVPMRYRARIGKSKISGTVSGTIKAGTKILYTIARFALRSRRR